VEDLEDLVVCADSAARTSSSVVGSVISEASLRSSVKVVVSAAAGIQTNQYGIGNMMERSWAGAKLFA
jgi:hypothetical protein